MTIRHQRVRAAAVGLGSTCLLAAGCTVSPPRPAADKILVRDDAPIFDQRFRDLEPDEVELSRFWVEREPGDPEAPVPLHSRTVADLVDGLSGGVVNLYTRILQEREARIGIEPADLLPFRIPVVSALLDFVPFSLPVPFRTEARSLGSAFLINGQGYLLTNAHVVLNATDIQVVRSGDREEIPARIIGLDLVTDTALLHMEPRPDMPVLPLGDSDALAVGEMVIAVGNPLGLNHTVTSGLVSAKERIIPGDRPQILDYLQTDSAINPGSSGGPLINLRGEVVGINTAIIERAQAIGFAIPIEIVKRVMPLLVVGKTDRGWFGASARPLEPGEAGRLGVDNPNAVFVTEVEPGSPAAAADLQVGDLVVAVGGHEIDSFVAMHRHLLGLLPGAELRLTIARAGERIEISSVLIEKPKPTPRGPRGPRRRTHGS